jgi:hypothetical protein
MGTEPPPSAHLLPSRIAAVGGFRDSSLGRAPAACRRRPARRAILFKRVSMVADYSQVRGGPWATSWSAGPLPTGFRHRAGGRRTPRPACRWEVEEAAVGAWSQRVPGMARLLRACRIDRALNSGISSYHTRHRERSSPARDHHHVGPLRRICRNRCRRRMTLLLTVTTLPPSAQSQGRGDPMMGGGGMHGGMEMAGMHSEEDDAADGRLDGADAAAHDAGHGVVLR